MRPLKERLKEILLRDKLVTPEALEKAVVEHKKVGGELSKVLIRLNVISEDQLSVALSESLNVPIIGLSSIKIDPAVVKTIPKEIARTYRIVPIARIGDQLTVAMSDPLNVFAIDNVKALTGLSVHAVIARPKEIQAAIERLYDADSSTTLAEILKDIKEAEDLELVKESTEVMDKREIENITREAPIITLTNTIIQQAVAAKASDVFIEPWTPPCASATVSTV